MVRTKLTVDSDDVNWSNMRYSLDRVRGIVTAVNAGT